MARRAAWAHSPCRSRRHWEHRSPAYAARKRRTWCADWARTKSSITPWRTTRGAGPVRPDRRYRGQPFDLAVPPRVEAQGRLRPARRLHESNLRLPTPRAAHLAGRAQEDGIPVVETLPKRRRGVPRGAHSGWEDQAGDRQNISVE